METPRTGVIYGLYDAADPDRRIRYVGQTINPDPSRRLNQHRYEARQEESYLAVHRWARKIGPDNVMQEILEQDVELSDLNDRETYWIEAHQTFRGWGSGGLNLTADGLGSVITDKSRKSQRDAIRITQKERSDSHLLRSRPESTPSEVIREIRETYRDKDVTIRDLAEEFQIGNHRVSRILLNEEWYDPGYTPPVEWRRQSRERRREKGIGGREGGLTWDDVYRIRDIWLEGQLTGPEIATMFGVSPLSLNQVVNNHTWVDETYQNTRGRAVPKSVGVRISRALKGRPKPEGFGKRGADNHSAKLTRDDVIDILQRLHHGEKGQDIADRYGVTPTAVSYIKKGKTWTDIPRPWEADK